MTAIMDKYFGPLPREYCMYFYALSILSAITFVMSAITIGYYVITHFKKVDAIFAFNSFYVLFSAFIAYIANRLLHTMCVKSI
jgi:hypothetical protein